jgi:hypothetical protein
VDGRGKAAQLEVHVTRLLRRFVPFVALILVVGTAGAQGRYRVLVGTADTQQVMLIEFSPCIPAETSACGAFVTRVIDTATDTTYGMKPPIVREQVAPDFGGAIAVQDGKLRIQSLVRNGRVVAAAKTITDPKRTATAVVISPDSRYAFAVFAANDPDEKSLVRMIDLDTRSPIASALFSMRPAGIAIAP